MYPVVDMPDTELRGSWESYGMQHVKGAGHFMEWMNDQVLSSLKDVWLPSMDLAYKIQARCPRGFVERRAVGVKVVDGVLAALSEYGRGADMGLVRHEHARVTMGGWGSTSAERALAWAWRGGDLFVVGEVDRTCVVCNSVNRHPLEWQSVLARTKDCKRCTTVRVAALELLNRTRNKAAKARSRALLDTIRTVDITSIMLSGHINARQWPLYLKGFYEEQSPALARHVAICAYLGGVASECPPQLQRDIEPWHERIGAELRARERADSGVSCA